ncbi:MAG: hypothetical protein O9262_00330 [Cyclobacteriaceae bacterium]|nr:hypothetical protein [Cyclobacteriaceae bacterium]
MRIHERRGEKISIDRVHHIEGKDQKGNYRFFKPIEPSFNRKVWAERSYTSARIVIYNTDIAPGAMYAGYKPKNCFYTKDNGPLLPLKLKTLKKDLGDSEASLEYLKKGKNIGKAQMGFRAASLALLIAGVVSFANDSSTDNQNMDEGPSVPPAIIGGVVCAWIPVFMESGKKQRYVEALKAYK